MSQEPLGTLLVKRGLITSDQLTEALADQKASGEPLGRIFVARGFATAATIAQALATQHGGVLKTEYGFAIGFSSSPGGPPVPYELPPITPVETAGTRTRPRQALVPTAVAVEAPRVADPESDREAVREELSSAAAAAETLRDDNARLVELRSQLEQRLATESRRAVSLKRELEAATATLEARDAAIADWQAGVAERDAAIEQFGVVAEEWKSGLAERDAAIAELVADRDEVRVQLREAKGALAAAPAAAHDLRVAYDEAVSRLKIAAAEEAAVQSARISGLEVERDTALERLHAAEIGADELAAANAATAAHRAESKAAAERAAALAQERDAAIAQLREAQAEIAKLAATSETAALEAPQADVAPWADADRHQLFFQGAAGYELVERDGPPPAPGSSVALETGPHVVARIAASPAPGPRVPCAYLVAT